MALLQLSFLTSMLNIHASAALPGLSQSLVEFKAIFNDSRLLEILEGHLMTSVRNDGYKILVKAENGRVIRGSIRDLPHPLGFCGPRTFEISKLKVYRNGNAAEVISPRSGGTTSATRLQDFKNMLGNLGNTHLTPFRTRSIERVELVGTNTFRISSSEDFGYHVDIPFTPTVYTPPEDHHSMP